MTTSCAIQGVTIEARLNRKRVRGGQCDWLSLIRFLCPLAMIASLQTLAHAQFLDDFNDNHMNPAVWGASIQGNGPTIAERNQQVECSVPADSSGAAFQAIYTTRCALHGDYDVQVSFALPVWPYSSGARITLQTDRHGAVERASLSPNEFNCVQPREVYADDFLGYGYNDICSSFRATGDVAGTLRITRVGNLLTGYHLSGGNWVVISTAVVPTDDTTVTIKAFSEAPYFAHMRFDTVFDDFVVNQGGRCFDGLTLPDQSTLRWLDCPSYQGVHDVVAGDLQLLKQTNGDFSNAGIRCVADNTAVAAASDPSSPAPGDGWFYIVRTAQPCGSGLYDEGSSSQVGSRDAEIAAAAGACQ